MRAAEGEDGAGEQDGLHAGGAEMLQSFFGDGFEMVGGGGAEFRGKFGACAGSELFGVNAEAEAVLLCAVRTVRASSTVKA